jgi:hypothetical protein
VSRKSPSSHSRARCSRVWITTDVEFSWGITSVVLVNYGFLGLSQSNRRGQSLGISR